MHILVTDLLTCPRCGPQFGLILLADEVVERRVQSGVLGCSNCREKYPIRDATAHFAATDAATGVAHREHDVERLAALVGIAHGPANILVAGPAADRAQHIAAMLEDVEVVAAGGGSSGAAPGGGGVSRVVTGRTLPFASGKLAGVLLTGAAADRLLEEGARVVSPVGRLVLEPVPPDAAERLERAGLRIAAQEGETAVALR